MVRDERIMHELHYIRQLIVQMVMIQMSILMMMLRITKTLDHHVISYL